MNYPHSGRFAGLILAVVAALLGACGESPSGPTAGAPGDDALVRKYGKTLAELPEAVSYTHLTLPTTPYV